MQDPTNPGDNWQHVPNTPTDPAVSAVPPTSDAGYQTPPNYPNYPPPGPPTGYPPPAEGLPPTTAAALAYLTFIPAVIFLIIDPYKRIPFVRFHAIQSIVLNVIWMLVWIVLGVVFTPLLFVGAWGTIHIISQIVRLAFFIGWLIAIIQAAQGKWFKLPLIGDFSLKQAQK
jgi:uncharacterized membrane protein